PRDVDRPGDVALVPLVVAANVDPEGAVEPLGPEGVAFPVLPLRLLEKFPVARHCFKNDSSASWHSRYRLEGLSQRVQLALTVAAGAVAAAGGGVGITLQTRDNPPKLHPQPGKPPVPARLPGAVGAQIQ